jgi:HlyD family secretion protein
LFESKGSSMTGRKKILIVVALIGIALAGAFYWFKPEQLTVSVVGVERGEVAATVANTRAGTVKACRRARLAPPRGGQMAILAVKEGDRVTEGQPLLELWNVDLRAELQLAKLEAIAAQGTADEVCVRADVSEQEAQRLTRLSERGLASEEENDSAVGDAKARAAGCAAANDAVKVSQARTAVAAARLEQSILRAPFDGIVAEINGELGEFVTPSPVGVPTPPAVDLIDNTCLYISAPIDEVDAPAVRAGQTAVITLDAFPGRDFSGLVRRVAPYVLDQEKQARTVEIEAEINDPDIANLLPGYSADVEVLLDIRQDVLMIPTQSVMEGSEVFVLAAGIIETRKIKTGISNWEFTEVQDGLVEGDMVVLSVDRQGVEDGVSASAE